MKLNGKIQANIRESLLGGASLDIIDLENILLKDFKWFLINNKSFGISLINLLKVLVNKF